MSRFTPGPVYLHPAPANPVEGLPGRIAVRPQRMFGAEVHFQRPLIKVGWRGLQFFRLYRFTLVAGPEGTGAGS